MNLLCFGMRDLVEGIKEPVSIDASGPFFYYSYEKPCNVVMGFNPFIDFFEMVNQPLT